jgi:hypothetical protein
LAVRGADRGGLVEFVISTPDIVRSINQLMKAPSTSPAFAFCAVIDTSAAIVEECR